MTSGCLAEAPATGPTVASQLAIAPVPIPAASEPLSQAHRFSIHLNSALLPSLLRLMRIKRIGRRPQVSILSAFMQMPVPKVEHSRMLPLQVLLPHLHLILWPHQSAQQRLFLQHQVSVVLSL